MAAVPIHVTLVGAGQVGRALAAAMRKRGIPRRLMPFRRGLPRSLGATRLILLCVRDGQIADAVQALASTKFDQHAIVAHVSGLVGLEPLLPLRSVCRGVGKLHPFCSIRAVGHPRDFTDVYFLGSGDEAACAVLRRLVRVLDGHYISGNHIDSSNYHLGAAMLANGAVALLHEAAKLLIRAKIDRETAEPMLVSLLDSVLYNVRHLGCDAALTGPVRRGDRETIQRHLVHLEHSDKDALRLYLELVRAQLDVVRTLSELDVTTQRELRRIVSRTRERITAGRSGRVHG